MGNSTGNANKKPTKTGQNDKTKRSWEEKGKDNTREKTVQLEEINKKEGRLKRYLQRVKQYRKNRTFQTTKENSINSLEGMTQKTYQQPDTKETERFWTKI